MVASKLIGFEDRLILVLLATGLGGLFHLSGPRLQRNQLLGVFMASRVVVGNRSGNCRERDSSGGRTGLPAEPGTTQALLPLSSIAAVVITASSRARARQRSNVCTETPISRDTSLTSALSGGKNRATTLFLNASPYRAISLPCRPGFNIIKRRQLF